MKFNPNYEWDASGKIDLLIPKSGLPFDIWVALWLWVGPTVSFVIGVSVREYAVLSLVGFVWVAFAILVRVDQISQSQHLDSVPISESEKGELIELGLLGRFADRTRLRRADSLNASSWLGKYTFSKAYWDCLTPSERVAVVQRLSRPYLVAFGWHLLVIAVVLVPLFLAIEHATANTIFASYPKEDARRYSEMLWKIPWLVLPIVVFNFTGCRLLYYGDQKFAEANHNVEPLIAALEKCGSCGTGASRVKRLRALSANRQEKK